MQEKRPTHLCRASLVCIKSEGEKLSEPSNLRLPARGEEVLSTSFSIYYSISESNMCNIRNKP